MTGNVEQVFDLYGDMILRLAMARTGNRQDGEDLLQEVFVRYIRSGIVFESEEHRKAWLIRVTINCSKSLMKSGWKTRHTSLEECHGMYDEIDRASEVYDAVMQLPARYRTVIHLFYYEELSTKQIAESMDCSEGTVRSLLSRGRKKLQKILKGEELRV
ncbi:MAG: RNA polymerase sigma factor [Ruminococcaceae bacterium]|nr:RNA polymerase sigma factor [Oscillospiraceae bacterium]